MRFLSKLSRKLELLKYQLLLRNVFWNHSSYPPVPSAEFPSHAQPHVGLSTCAARSSSPRSVSLSSCDANPNAFPRALPSFPSHTSQCSSTCPGSWTCISLSFRSVIYLLRLIMCCVVYVLVWKWACVRVCVQKWLSYLKLEKLEVGFQLPCSLSHLPAAVIHTPVRFTWRTRWSGDPRGANHLLP